MAMYRLIIAHADVTGELNHDFEVLSDYLAELYARHYSAALPLPVRTGWTFQLWDMTPDQQRLIGHINRDVVIEFVGARTNV